MPSNKLLAMNITVAIYRRHKETDDRIGGRVSTYPNLRHAVPARIVSQKAPLQFQMQGIQTQDFYSCEVYSPDYTAIDVQADDIVVPESGQYQGQQFRVQTVNESSVDDNPNSYRASNKLLSIKRETPRADLVLSG